MDALTTSSTRVQRRANRRRRLWRLLALLVAVLVCPLVGVSVGAATVPIGDVVGIVAHHLGLSTDVTWRPSVEAIVWENRVPRVLAGVLVGAVLGVSGVALQAVVRNPLAEPFVLGVSAGASTGAAAAIIVLGVVQPFLTSLLAFVGALVATLTLLLVAGRAAGPLQLILGGLAVGFGFHSATNVLVFSSGSPETAQSVMFWMLGSLGRTQWEQLPLLAAAAVALVASLWLVGPILDALASGDRTCESIGVNPRVARLAVLLPVSAAVGVAVAAAGGIGFVGLIIPHLMRRFVGYSHRWLVPASALGAAAFLVATDAVARVVFAPVELPIGVVTGLIGAPFLALLVRRDRAVR